MKRWSNYEVQFLIKNYATKDISFCCEILNRSESQIKQKAVRLRIKRKKNIYGENNPNWKGGCACKICSYCGKEYYVKRIHSKSKFCSSACYGLSQTGIKKGKNPDKYTKNICLVCNNEYEVRTCHYKRSKTCSLECASKYRSMKSSGENNPSWKGGLSRIPYPYNWANISKSIIERDGAICMNPNCGEKNKRITVHHIDYDKMNCNPENLITVCDTCNSVANFGRKRWFMYYMDIQNKRGISSFNESISKLKTIKDNDGKGENHPMSKLTRQDIYEIRSYLSIFKTRGTKASLAKLFNVSQTNIGNIENFKLWK